MSGKVEWRTPSSLYLSLRSPQAYVGPEPFPLRQMCNVPYYLRALVARVGSYESFKFRETIERLKTGYEHAESLEPTLVSEMKPSHLRGTIRLAEIAKDE